MKRLIALTYTIMAVIFASAKTVTTTTIHDTIDVERSFKTEVLNFGVEFGVNILSQDVTPPANVKLGNHNAHAYYVPWHLGATVEYLFAKDMFGIGSGLRLTNYTAYYGRSNGTGYYYWNIDPENAEGEYIKISSTKQANMYLGVPIQFRIFCIPINKSSFTTSKKGVEHIYNAVRPYFKIDLAFNFNINSKNTFAFVDDDGKLLEYTEIMQEALGKAEKFNSVLDLAYGLRVGTPNWPCTLNAEIHFPTFLLTNSPVSFFEASDLTALNMGVKFALQVPLVWGESFTSKSKQIKKMVQTTQLIPESEQQPAEDDSNGSYVEDNR